jgi:hypothetical protein
MSAVESKQHSICSAAEDHCSRHPEEQEEEEQMILELLDEWEAKEENDPEQLHSPPLLN